MSPKRTSTLRLVNGIICLVLVCIFLAHELLGGGADNLGLGHTLAWVVWIGAAGIVVHVALSVGTTVEMMRDEEHPPSKRKRDHQVLKWVSGGLVLVFALFHIFARNAFGDTFETVSVALLAAALAWHICIGAKSLLSDISVPRGFLTAFRIVVCLLSAVAVVLYLV